MLVKTFGSAVYGVDAITITIEVNVLDGLHTFIVGLADNAIKESIRRVESAIKSNGYRMPRTKLIVSLAPADIRKTGSAFDLAIAIGTLAASGQLKNTNLLEKFVIMGELNLDGGINPIKGALPIAITTQKEGFEGLILPIHNCREAAMVSNLKVFGISSLADVIRFFEYPDSFQPTFIPCDDQFITAESDYEADFSDVYGQENIKRALEIAAAGGHNAVLIGPPGAGKTMLARRLPSIMPALNLFEAIETTKIHSVAGKLPANSTLVYKRPFRAPHHTISDIALVGGGSTPQPGEISLAHNGILFLDEFPEFRRSVLEVMRQPLEERKVTISRSGISIDFPAGFMLIAAMNPCPCGFYNHPEKTCTCSTGMIQKYLNRISGPLLDRIDLHVEVVPVPHADLITSKKTESSATVKKRVMAAREIQMKRFAKTVGYYSNAQAPPKMLKEFCVLNKTCRRLINDAMSKFSLSARAYDRIIKVARTIADLAEKTEIEPEFLAEAIQYRTLDREGWSG